MELNDFVKLFAEQFDDTPAEKFTPDLNFRSLDEWDSLKALTIISMVDDEFSRQITGAELRNINTIKELYSLAQKK